MSGNSCESALQTAPIVRALPGPCGGWPGLRSGPTGASPSDGAGGCSVRVSSAIALAREVGQLVLADLQLVAVLEAVGIDPAAVDVGAVERARVVQVPPARAAHELGVVARDRDVVEEDLGVGRAPDHQALAAQRAGLPDPPAARADDERAALGRDVADVDRAQLARGLIDDVRRRRDVVARGLVGALEGAALGTVVRPLTDDEAALWAMTGHSRAGPGALEVVAAGRPAGEDVRQPLHVRTG